MWYLLCVLIPILTQLIVHPPLIYEFDPVQGESPNGPCANFLLVTIKTIDSTRSVYFHICGFISSCGSVIRVLVCPLILAGVSSMCSITYSYVSEHLIWWPGGEEGMAVSKAQLVRCPGWHFVPTYLGQQMSHLICWPGYEGTKCQPGHLTNYALRISKPPSPPGHQMSCCISWLFRVSYY